MDWDFIVVGFSVSGRPFLLPPGDRLALLRAEVQRDEEERFWDKALERIFGQVRGGRDNTLPTRE